MITRRLVLTLIACTCVGACGVALLVYWLRAPAGGGATHKREYIRSVERVLVDRFGSRYSNFRIALPEELPPGFEPLDNGSKFAQIGMTGVEFHFFPSAGSGHVFPVWIVERPRSLGCEWGASAGGEICREVGETSITIHFNGGYDSRRAKELWSDVLFTADLDRVKWLG